MTRDHLRPIERVVLRLADAGLTESEIAWRLRRSPGHVQRLRMLTALPRAAEPGASAVVGPLRPVERCVLRAREAGTELPEIAARLRRSPGHVSRVEAYATYKLGREGGSGS